MKRIKLELNSVASNSRFCNFNFKTFLRYVFVILHILSTLILGMLVLVAFLAYSFASGKDWR